MSPKSLPNDVYWAKRFEALIERELGATEAIIKTEIASAYRDADRALRKDIESWMERFARTNDVSLASARKMISAGELDEFKWDVQQYIKEGQAQNLFFDEARALQMENASARIHISRLDEIRMRMAMHADKLAGTQKNIVEAAGTRIIENVSSGTAALLGEVGAGLDVKRVEQILASPWSADGEKFSKRIWGNRTSLVSQLDKGVAQSLIRGDDVTQLTKTLSKAMKSSEHQAARLLMTESTAFASAAQKETYKDLDVKFVEIIETNDAMTCEQCAEMDGKVIAARDMEPGVTVPPFHPWCRGTTAPWFKDDDDYPPPEE